MEYVAVLTTMLLTAALAFAQAADTVSVKNGDTLRGTLVGVRNGVLTFRTEIAGKIILPTDEVTALNIGEPVTVILPDGRTETGVLSTSNGALTLLSESGKEPLDIDLDKVTISRQKQEKPSSYAPPIAAETGIVLYSGTDTFAAPYLRIDFDRDYYTRGARAAVYLADDGSGEFPRLLNVDVDWIFGNEARLGPRAIVEFERTAPEALESSVRIGLLAGRSFRDGSARIDAGLVGAFERFDRDLLDRNNFRQFIDDIFYGVDTTATENRLDLGMSFSHLWVPNDRNRLRNELWLTPSLSELGELRARTESSYTRSLTEKLDLKLDLRLDYNSDPEYTDLDRWRGTLGAGIRWGF
jgi:small nuclear ribonucleoprotein (snRNP)-like protein